LPALAGCLGYRHGGSTMEFSVLGALVAGLIVALVYQAFI
jgi:hypothetical protein